MGLEVLTSLMDIYFAEGTVLMLLIFGIKLGLAALYKLT